MEYNGKLYGRVGKSYFPLCKTADDFNTIVQLLRETAMRSNLALPENEIDLKWFDEGVAIDKSGDFMERLFETLDLGNTGSKIENT